MRTKLLAAAALLIASAAQAEDLCVGMPVAESNKVIAAFGSIQGTEPVDTLLMTCGGGVSKEGERLTKWPCFIQTWAASSGGALIVYFQRRGGDWALNAVLWRGVGEQAPTGLSLEPCAPTAPAKNAWGDEASF